MLSVGNRLMLGLCIVAALTVPAMAEESSPCDAFTKSADGDWVAKRDMTVSGSTGLMEIKAGRLVDDDTQDQLDDECK